MTRPRVIYLEDDQILAAAVAIDYWIKNIPQEETNAEEFLTMEETLEELRGFIR